MSAHPLNNRRPLPSTSELLPSFISTAQARHILGRGGDAREIFAQVAHLRGQSEQELMVELGRLVGLPCADSISRTTSDTRWDSEFLRYGALPEVLEGRVIGAYCIDPYRIRHLISAEMRQSIVLVPWSLLCSYLTDSSPRPLVAKDKENTESTAGALKLLELMLDEAKSLGRDRVFLSITSRGISYEFEMEDGDPLTGLIEDFSACNGAEVRALAQTGTVIALEGGAHITLSSDSLGRFILTEVLPDLPQRASLAFEETKKSNCPKNVLFIEDDPAFSSIVSEVLATSGYLVKTSSSLSEALTVLRDGPPPQAIISDLNIADASGHNTIAQLLANNVVKPDSVVVLSNEDDGQLEAALLRLGVRGVIAKNRDPEVLLAYLEQMIDSRIKSQGET